MQVTQSFSAQTQATQDEWLTQENLEYMVSYLKSDNCTYDTLVALRQCWKAHALKEAVKLVPEPRRSAIASWVRQQNEQMEF